MEIDAMKLTAILGLVAVLPLTGCNDGDPANTAAPKSAPAAAVESSADESGHSHGSGPHGGAIADWGGGAYHVEFTVDHGAKQSTVYILGSDGKTAAPIKAEKLTLSINEPAYEVELRADPREGEANGASSRFVGQHEKLGVVQEFAGSISGEVDGTPYIGEFAEVAGEN
jgi:hypothetical protein